MCNGECDFTKYHMFLDLGSTSDLRDKFTVYVTFSLRTKVKYLNISVIPFSLPSDFREKLWVGLGLGVGIG